MRRQGAGGAATRILNALKKEGRAQWWSDGKDWGWRIIGCAAALLALSTVALHAHAQPFTAADDILARQPTATTDDAKEVMPADSADSRAADNAGDVAEDDDAASPVRVAMGTVCPIYDAPPGEKAMRCDLTLGLSMRPASWKRLPHVHPFVGFGTRSLTVGVAYAMSERYAVGVGAMALREDYLDVSRVAPAVAFTVSIGGTSR
jgi:hypothetical protein